VAEGIAGSAPPPPPTAGLPAGFLSADAVFAGV
jgi:hypothetical protein